MMEQKLEGQPVEEPISPHGGGVISRAAASAEGDHRRRVEAATAKLEAENRRIYTERPGAEPSTMPTLPDAQLRLAFYQASGGNLDAASAAYKWAVGEG